MAKARREPEVAADRETVSVLAQTGLTPAALREADNQLLLTLQTQLLMGNKWGAWEVAANLIADHAVTNSKRMFRLELAIPSGMDPVSAEAQAVWAELMRFAIARRCFALKYGRASRPKLSTIGKEIQDLAKATRLVAGRSGDGFWARCTNDELLRCVGEKRGKSLTNLLRKLRDRGAIADAPRGRSKPKGAAPSRDRTDEPEHTQKPEVGAQYLPLPDRFTAAGGQRALYLTEQLGPCLLDALEECAAVPLRRINTDPRSPNYGQPLAQRQSKKVRARILDSIIAEWPWQSVSHGVGRFPDFDLFFSQSGSGEFAWPPRTFVQALSALNVLQGAHLFLIALADGGRNGELLSVQEGALGRVEGDAPTLTTRTRKVEANGSRSHEVPLPSAVQAAVTQQERLARIVKSFFGVNGHHVWVQTAQSRGTPLKDFRGTLYAFARALRLEGLLGDSNLHMHRFRKTLARIVALALIHAPKILREIFGHKDEQMTIMRYILSTPGLMEEIREVTQELLVLKGVWLVENLDKIQGKGAVRFRQRWEQHAQLIGRRALEPQSIRDFVEVCFENGQALAIIGPGILCTSFTKGGRCNKHGGGTANPQHCSPECEHQVACPTYESADTFEEEDAILKALNTADYLLTSLAEAEEQGEDMLVATFGGQIRDMLGRWREVDQHVATHPKGRGLIPVNLVSA